MLPTSFCQSVPAVSNNANNNVNCLSQCSSWECCTQYSINPCFILLSIHAVCLHVRVKRVPSSIVSMLFETGFHCSLSLMLLWRVFSCDIFQCCNVQFRLRYFVNCCYVWLSSVVCLYFLAQGVTYTTVFCQSLLYLIVQRCLSLRSNGRFICSLPWTNIVPECAVMFVFMFITIGSPPVFCCQTQF